MKSASLKRKVRRRAKAPPGEAVSRQPEFSLRLHGIEIEINNQTTVTDYEERQVSATFLRLFHLTRPSSLALL